MPILSKMAEQGQGQFILAKINSDQNQDLAQQFGVRSLPTVKLFKNGQPVDEFMGALPESQIQAFIDQHIDRESDKVHARAIEALQANDQETALKLLQEANAMDPERAQIAVDLATLMADVGQSTEAVTLLKTLSKEEQGAAVVAALLARLEFAGSAESLPDVETLKTQAAEGDLEAKLQLSNKLVADGSNEAAMIQLLEIMQKDREFKDDIGRTTLLKIFDMLGADPLVDQYRRKMFNFLY
jgi:putative thioredoxin